MTKRKSSSTSQQAQTTLERVEVLQDTIMLDYLIHTEYRTQQDPASKKFCVLGKASERRTAWRVTAREAIGDLLEKEPLKNLAKSAS